MADGTWPCCVTPAQAVVHLAAVQNGLHLAGVCYTGPLWATPGLDGLHLAVVGTPGQDMSQRTTLPCCTQYPDVLHHVLHQGYTGP